MTTAILFRHKALHHRKMTLVRDNEKIERGYREPPPQKTTAQTIASAVSLTGKLSVKVVPPAGSERTSIYP